MRKHKFYFNMVEIALAIAIIAIGVSSIMVLFPIGINATRAAMDETNCPDAAEFTARFVRGKVLAFWKAQADANPSSPNFTKPTCFEKNAEKRIRTGKISSADPFFRAFCHLHPSTDPSGINDPLYRSQRIYFRNHRLLCGPFPQSQNLHSHCKSLFSQVAYQSSRLGRLRPLDALSNHHGRPRNARHRRNSLLRSPGRRHCRSRCRSRLPLYPYTPFQKHQSVLKAERDKDPQ